ncbi:hypothetical protein COO60DRAFT_288359 [Scenedesmus sp. NREL 46B-D3]|nr:hypothetical protein COO60DRAFT_288359 [Scenedesmus sp. NREL 46B-D3]
MLVWVHSGCAVLASAWCWLLKVQFTYVPSKLCKGGGGSAGNLVAWLLSARAGSSHVHRAVEEKINRESCEALSAGRTIKACGQAALQCMWYFIIVSISHVPYCQKVMSHVVYEPSVLADQFYFGRRLASAMASCTNNRGCARASMLGIAHYCCQQCAKHARHGLDLHQGGAGVA